jgi:hypothetical protein
MIWKKVDPDNLPEGEVLAYGNGQYVYGFLTIDDKGWVQAQNVECQDDYEIGITHYCELTKPEE